MRSNLLSRSVVSLLVLCCIVSLSGQQVNNATPQLYLLAGTLLNQSPTTLFRVGPEKALVPVQEVLSRDSRLFNVLTADSVIFCIYPAKGSTSVSVIHTDDPPRVDDVVFDPNPMGSEPIASLAEPQPSSFDLMLLFSHPNEGRLNATLATVSGEQVAGQPRVASNRWEDYVALRFSGRPGRPAVVNDGLFARAVGNDFVIGSPAVGGQTVVDALSPAIREPDKLTRPVEIAAVSANYFATYIPPAAPAPSTLPASPSSESRSISVHNRMKNTWKTVKVEGNESRSKLFGNWLATIVQDFDLNQEPSPGRDVEPPNIRSWYDDSIYWRPGILILNNFADGRTIRIKTDLEDSEILWVGTDSLLYRENNTIYQARIVGNQIQNAAVLAQGGDVPEIHWVFWSK